MRVIHLGKQYEEQNITENNKRLRLKTCDRLVLFVNFICIKK